MSSITGGIFSRPKGTTGGLVFGAARSRTGKVVTIREKVDPSNPNTAGQITQRTIFSEVLTIVRTFGAAVYQVGWNRAIGQLPGFQSLMSVFMQQMNASFEVVLTLAINLGILHVPGTLTVTDGGGGAIDVDWSTELGANGTANDECVIIFCAKTQAQRLLPSQINASTGTLRSAGTKTLGGYTVGQTYEVYVYFLGAGTAAGLKSIANPFEVTLA